MTGADLAQPIPTPIHTTPPYPNGMWGVSIRLRRSGRSTGRPMEGDTCQVSTNQPTPPWCHITDTLCSNAHPQHEILTQHLLPALWATACRVDCGCNQLTMTQQPYHPSQPHEQLLMGWIIGLEWRLWQGPQGDNEMTASSQTPCACSSVFLQNSF